nr:MAG TPA: Putative tail protein [Caudoviricetes sp.]
MSKLNIYHKDGSFLTDANEEQITIKGLEYSDSWMGECFVTISIKNAAPVKFEIGDYIMYRGERFELNYDPGKQKQARKDSYGDGFVYDSVKFNALQDELSRTEFLDVVLNDNQLHYTSLPKFQFYVETIDDLLDRIQANLNEQIDVGKWKIFSRSKSRSMQRGVTEAEWDEAYGEGTEDFSDFDSKSITIDSKTCWEALALSNSEWDINFIVRNRCVYVGTAGVTTQNIFKYGLGNGLYEIDQNADSDQSIITRLRAYGSEKNLPEHYYADLGSTPFLNITGDYNASSTENGLSVMLENSEFNGMFTNIKSENGSNMKRVLVSCKIDDYLFDAELELVLKEGTTCTTRLLIDNDKTVSDAVKAKIDAGFKQVLFLSGAKATKFNKNRINYVQNLPNNMSINRLMLPGFPRLSLKEFWDSLTDEEKKYVNPSRREHVFSTDKYRPYIDSINLEKIGLRSASQFFDTDDKTNGVIEIYPTIEEMEIGGVRVDEIYTGSNVEDNGRFDDGQTVANIDIYLNPAIDFDINDLRNDDFTISMKDGMCGGRDLKVASCSKIDGKWRLTIERVKDDALNLWFPYKDYQIKKGDHFVLTGIELPDSYIRAASLKLLKYAIALLDKNDYTRYVYQPKVDEIFMARQHDQAMDDKTGTIKSLHDTLKAGDLMRFEDEDLGIDAEITIDQLTIKEEDGKIPTYDITLREDKEVGTIQKIQQQISSLESGNGGNGGGLTASQVKSQVASEGSKYFLSKLKDDTAAGIIIFQQLQKFLKGMKVGANGDWTLDELDNTHLTTDYLQVRMKAIFETLEILHTDTSGGELFITPVGSNRILKVEEVNITYDGVSQKAYRCYFLGEQDGSKVENKWKVGDQARSKSFNLTQGKYHNVGNHYYWRLVIGVSTETVEIDGKKYHYVDLSDIDKDAASDEPMVDDILNQCGNRADNARQSCLVFSAVDTYSPSVTLYHGVNGYTFNNKEYVAYGVNHSTNKAFFHVYGDMYVGDRPTKENGYEGSSYIRYDSSTKQMSVKAKISAKSTVDGKELSQYFKKIAELQNQVDGAIETWFYEGVPTLENAPAISWKTDKDKEIHLGDLYYEDKTGKAYRFAKDSNTYKWTLITDTDIAKALSDARMAQETANGKMKVFSVQPTTPYQVGDIWVNATYPSDGSTYKNEVLRCQTNKAAGSQFAIGDWIKASKYTDDTVANAAKKAAEEAQKAAQTAQTDITNLGKTVTTNKKAFDNYVKDGYLEPSEIAAMAQDSKRLEDDFAAAQKSYNEVKGAEVLKNTKELTDLKTAFATLSTAKTELVTYLSDISARYNAANTEKKATIVSEVGTKFTNFQSAYSAFYDKLGLANAYITSKIYGDLKQNITDLAGYKYLKDALGQTTDIDGGLVMTTLLALRDGDGNVQSGINGAIDPNRGKKSIATWWGGQMVDKDYNSGNLTPATSLIRFDGSGYLANGAIWWDVSGKVHADPTSFIISEKNLGAYLIFFEPTWKEGSAGTSVADLVSLKPNAPFSKIGVSGDATFEGAISFHGIKLTYDSTNKAIKIDGNLYATGGITAYGAGTSTSTGGGLNGSVKSYADALKLTSESLSEVASAYSIKALSRRIDNIATELGGLSLSWDNITGKPSTFAPSAHTHKWAEITDRITKVSQLTNDSGYTKNTGTVTSVSLTLPAGLTCATKTITTSGTFAISLASGYSIPTTAKQTAWDSAYDWYALMTTDEETADGIINKWNEVVSFLANIAQTDTLSGIVDGINKSISDEVARAKKAEGVNASGISANKTSITTLQGYFTNGSAKKALQLTNARKLWGNSFNGLGDINGSIIVPSGKYISIGNIKLEYDAANKALKITNTTTEEVANLYTSGGVSAYGAGTSSSSGGGGLNGSVKAYNDALKLTSESLSEIASAYSIKQLSTRITSLEGGSATSISVSGSGNAVTSVTKNGTTISVVKGSTFLTSHQSLASYLTKTDAASLYQPKGNYLTAHQSLDGYLKLSGGAMTGNIRYKGSKSTFDMIKFVDNNADTFGNGICIGGGGLTIIGGGESADIVLSQHTSGGDENMIVANDNAIDFFSNVQNGWNSRKAGSFDTSGYWNGAGFKKDNSSDSYVLLGGGGHKAISSLSVNYASSAGSANSVAWSNVSGRPTKLSQLTNDKNFVTGSVSGQTITINGVSTTWQNTWRGITDSYSGTSTGTSLSQKGANSLYNDLHNGYASSAGNADTVDSYHANTSQAPYGRIPTIATDGVMEIGKYIDFHNDNSGKYDFSTRLQTGGNYVNVVNLPSSNGTLALTSDNVASATKLQTARSIWGQSFDGTGNVNGTIYINNSNSSNGAIRLNNNISANARISAIDNQVIFNTGNAIRFGETDWDWNQWAGLKYNHSKKTIYLGIADGSVFYANSAQTGGSLYFPAINDVYCYRSFNIVGGSANVNGTIYDYCTIYGKDSITCVFGVMAPSNTIYLNDHNDITLSSYAGVNLTSNTGNSITLNASSASVVMNTDSGVTIKSNNPVALNVGGTILAKGGVTAYSSSDIRLKTDLRKLDYLGIIKAMGGTFGFAWKKDNTRSIGWIAQHVLCNTYLKDIVETDEKGYYKINYWSPKLIATAFGAIEQVDDEVTRLKKKVKTLENRVKELEIK